MDTREPQTADAEPIRLGWIDTWKLAGLFGAFYFVQGVAEPTEGLIAQPVNSLLRRWGHGAADIGQFAFLLGLPWLCKPPYGLLSDFFPLCGYRRKSYLVLTSGITAAALVALYAMPLPPGSEGLLLALLFPVSLAVAFSDVVVDGLMVETGQPTGLTGRLQSVQWTMIWLASIFTGSVGGRLSGTGHQQSAFLLCGLVTATTFLLSFGIREPRRACDVAGMRQNVRALWQSTHSRALLAAAAFLFLWNFNPFSSSVLNVHMIKGLGYSEQFYGDTRSLLAVASMTGSLLYGFYCRRVPMWLLVHLSIVLGIASNLAYWLMIDATGARVAAIVAGLTNATAVMIQLDLAAQRCPPQVAGTMFALLMSLSNLGISLSTWLGGLWYERWSERNDPVTAFNWLVGVGAVFTACCWILTPLINGPARVNVAEPEKSPQ